MNFDYMSKVLFSLNASKGQFQNLRDLELESFIVLDDNEGVSISYNGNPSVPSLIIVGDDVSQEGDGAYFTQINDWCRELDGELEKLVLKSKS